MINFFKEKFQRIKQWDFSYENITVRIKQLIGIGLSVLVFFMTASNPDKFYIPLSVGGGLILSFIIRNLLRIKLSYKIPFYLADTAFLFLLSITIGDTLISILYICILTDFYLSSSKMWANAVFTSVYFISYVAIMIFSGHVTKLGSFVLNELITFLLVFLIVNLCIIIANKNDVIEKNLMIVSEREEKLRQAYKELEEVTALKERNRIAQEIHDTTGHSITTIIMQTEAAKLIIDKDPEEAKRRIISANMQAVSALEEMRKSIHLLSGENSQFDLIFNLNRVIAETMEGTGIVIRSKIDDDLGFLAPKLARMVYSALKECLNNGIRHGKSTAFYFELKKVEGGFYFLLSDNGTGSSGIKLGYGLKHIKENFDAEGYKATFKSSPGEGFEIKIQQKKRGRAYND